MLVPDLPSFLNSASGRRMPVYREILADVETPVSAWWKLAQGETYGFLLESVTGGENVGRYSILGVGPRAVLRAKNGTATREEGGTIRPVDIPEGGDPLDLLREVSEKETVRIPGLPAFCGGAVGMLAYDMVRYFERLPDSTVDDLQVPDLAMMLVDTFVVFDHAKNVARIVHLAEGSEEGYRKAETEIERVAARLAAPLPPLPTGSYEPKEVTANRTPEDFMAAVSRVKEYITQGDGVQMVPSQRFQREVEAHPLTIYRALRSINPSPYMFLFRFGDFDIVGASPEILVSLHGDRARVRPIAGTRWRGQTEEEDVRLGVELLADEKEIAEHVMLVDLGRNDLGRVCDYGSVEVNDIMVIERYSHVMHIVSDVTGRLRATEDALGLLRATFPAGTVSGAPKVRAMQVIDECEPTRRGLYAGAVGFLSAQGDLDMCIALRTILLKDGKAFVQAGGGVVYDSDPAYEYRESRNKAQAALSALARAEAGL
ncbi:anthranilate synthase component I [bacterium]|nr:MAG: anthranilate synthase component I [bacterium]